MPDYSFHKCTGDGIYVNMTLPQRVADLLLGARTESLGDTVMRTRPKSAFLSLFEGAARCGPIWKPLFAPGTTP